MREETYKGFTLQLADSEHEARRVARQSRNRTKQPSRSWYVKDGNGRVVDSRLTRASARRAVNGLLEASWCPA